MVFMDAIITYLLCFLRIYCITKNNYYLSLKREESKIDEVNDFMVFHQYSDEPTMRLVSSVAKVAGKYFLALEGSKFIAFMVNKDFTLFACASPLIQYVSMNKGLISQIDHENFISWWDKN